MLTSTYAHVPWSKGFKNQFQELSLIENCTLKMSLCKLVYNGDSVLRPIMAALSLYVQSGVNPETWELTIFFPFLNLRKFANRLTNGTQPWIL